MFNLAKFLPWKSLRISFKMELKPTTWEKFKFYKSSKTLKKSKYQEIDQIKFKTNIITVLMLWRPKGLNLKKEGYISSLNSWIWVSPNISRKKEEKDKFNLMKITKSGWSWSKCWLLYNFYMMNSVSCTGISNLTILWSMRIHFRLRLSTSAPVKILP